MVLLIVLQRAVEVAGPAEYNTKLIMGNSEIDDRGRRKQLKRLLKTTRRIVEKLRSSLSGRLFSGVVKTLQSKVRRA